jgi:hypothetical protein
VNAFILTMCILHPAGYCADVIQERYRSMPECMAVASKYERDKRVLVHCSAEGHEPVRRTEKRAPENEMVIER